MRKPAAEGFFMDTVMGRRKKVGIMGGTFNPVHMGHLLLAENAYSMFSLDEILFIPSGCSYMKDPRGDRKSVV